MKQLQAWTNDASMESKILAALAKRCGAHPARLCICIAAGDHRALARWHSMTSEEVYAYRAADVEGGHYDSGHIGGLRARSSNLGGFASRTSSMTSLAGHQDHAAGMPHPCMQ